MFFESRLAFSGEVVDYFFDYTTVIHIFQWAEETFRMSSDAMNNETVVSDGSELGTENVAGLANKHTSLSQCNLITFI